MKYPQIMQRGIAATKELKLMQRRKGAKERQKAETAGIH